MKNSPFFVHCLSGSNKDVSEIRESAQKSTLKLVFHQQNRSYATKSLVGLNSILSCDNRDMVTRPRPSSYANVTEVAQLLVPLSSSVCFPALVTTADRFC